MGEPHGLLFVFTGRCRNASPSPVWIRRGIMLLPVEEPDDGILRRERALPVLGSHEHEAMIR